MPLSQLLNINRLCRILEQIGTPELGHSLQNSKKNIDLVGWGLAWVPIKA
jgi:hypothetical protein